MEPVTISLGHKVKNFMTVILIGMGRYRFYIIA